jgi:acetyl esterase/lipase
MVSLTEGQKAALSPEAINFLQNVHHLPFASLLSNFVAMPSRVPALRRDIEQKMAPGEAALITKHNIKLKDVTIAGVPVIVIEPGTIAAGMEKKIMFNVFGGAFIIGSATDRAALTMAGELGVRVFSINYSKAPEAKYPVARDQCLEVYRALVQKGLVGGAPIDPADIYAMGSSSGAQLILSMFIKAREEGLPLPTAGLYLCTPAVDLSGAGDSAIFNARDRDIMPTSLLYSMVSQNYFAGKVDLQDPLISPIYSTYDKTFPRTVITVGTRDFALSNGIRFYWKLREAGVDVELLVSEGMWHGFVWDPIIPEALVARAAVIEFLKRGA